MVLKSECRSQCKKSDTINGFNVEYFCLSPDPYRTNSDGGAKIDARVQATLNQNTPENPEQMNLLISTERLANVVPDL